MKLFGYSIYIITTLLPCITFGYKELMIKDIDGKGVNVIKVVLDGEHYIVSSLAQDGGDTLENLTTRLGANTSVNGVFFCPKDYSYCNGQTYSISERIYLGNAKENSRLWPDTGIRGIFGFTAQGDPIFAQNNVTKRPYFTSDVNSGNLDKIYFGLGNFPVLLISGENVVALSEPEMDNKIRNAGTKSFICSTQDGQTVYMGYVRSVTIYQFADFIKKNFNCRNAINIDAGKSLGMIYDGNVLARGERRNIMDAFVVVNKTQYAELIGFQPQARTAYIDQTPKYDITDSEQTLITNLNKVIRKKGSDYRRKTVVRLRKLLGNEKIQSDTRVYTILYKLLIKLHTLDTLK